MPICSPMPPQLHRGQLAKYWPTQCALSAHTDRKPSEPFGHLDGFIHSGRERTAVITPRQVQVRANVSKVGKSGHDETIGIPDASSQTVTCIIVVGEAHTLLGGDFCSDVFKEVPAEVHGLYVSGHMLMATCCDNEIIS